MAKSHSTRRAGKRVPKTTEPSIASALESQRQRLFLAMNLVKTTALSCEERDFARRETLNEAHRIISDVALELNRIGGEP